jgi:hypothetical protein
MDFFTPYVFSFANGVKDAARDGFNWDGKKDTKGRQLLQDVGKTGRQYDKDIWIKKMLNERGDDTFIIDFMVIDDWRFINEADYLINNVPELQVVKIRIESPEREILKGTEQYNDISEISLPSIPVEEGTLDVFFYKDKEIYDYIIVNTGTLSDLAQTVGTIMETEVKKLFY